MHTLFMTIGLAVAVPSSAWACSCGKPRNFAELPDGAVLLFEGTAVEVDHVDTQYIIERPGEPTRYYVGQAQRTRFRVLRYWKGSNGHFVNIDTDSGHAGSMCGWRFELGQHIRVLAYRGLDGSWTTGYCAMMSVQ